MTLSEFTMSALGQCCNEEEADGMKTLLHELIVPAVRNGVAATCDWGLVPMPSVTAALNVRARRNSGDGGESAAEVRQVVGDGDDNLSPSAASEQDVYDGDGGTSPAATSHSKS